MTIDNLTDVKCTFPAKEGNYEFDIKDDHLEVTGRIFSNGPGLLYQLPRGSSSSQGRQVFSHQEQTVIYHNGQYSASPKEIFEALDGLIGGTFFS